MKIDTYVKLALTVIALCLVVQVAHTWSAAEPLLAAPIASTKAVAQGGPAGPMEVVIVGLRMETGAKALPVGIETIGDVAAAGLVVEVPTNDDAKVAGPGFRVSQYPARSPDPGR